MSGLVKAFPQTLFTVLAWALTKSGAGPRSSSDNAVAVLSPLSTGAARVVDSFLAQHDALDLRYKL